MGKHNLAAQKVHSHISQLLKINHITSPPAWYKVLGNIPSSEVLTRKATHGRKTASQKASRLFQPVQLKHKEDDLRWEFFNDHPWELARPRVVLENDGKDVHRWDWSHALCPPEYKTNSAENAAAIAAWHRKQETQASRPINGEAVIQRQRWLMANAGQSEAAAYDTARKELYSVRHAQEIEQRVAKEEAMHYGAQFGLSANEIGMQLEDKSYEDWRAWAAKDIAAYKQIASSAYTGQEAQELEDEAIEVMAEQVVESIPGSKAGSRAAGGAAVRP